MAQRPRFFCWARDYVASVHLLRPVSHPRGQGPERAMRCWSVGSRCVNSVRAPGDSTCPQSLGRPSPSANAPQFRRMRWFGAVGRFLRASSRGTGRHRNRGSRWTQTHPRTHGLRRRKVCLVTDEAPPDARSQYAIAPCNAPTPPRPPPRARAPAVCSALGLGTGPSGCSASRLGREGRPNPGDRSWMRPCPNPTPGMQWKGRGLGGG